VINRRLSHAALAVAGLFAASNMGAVVHFATTRHVRCLEHHELMHVGKARFDPWLLVETGDHVKSEPRGVNTRHEHCSLTLLQQVRMAMFTRVVDVHPVDPIVAVLPRRGHRDRTPVALYLVAPKTSPPVVA
jgi:hypothetical protein